MQLSIDKKNLLLHQFEFLTNPAPIKALVCGYGAGKTYAFLRKTLINHIIRKRDDTGLSEGWILYPTLELAEDVFVDDFRALLDKVNIKHKYNKQNRVIKSNYGKIKIYTMEKPERIVGSNLTYAGVDEFDTAVISKGLKTYKKILGRLRGCSNTELYIVTTPEGFSSTYNIFVENPKESQLLIQAKTTDNPFLPENYIESLREQYDPRLLKAYLDGQFVNLNAGSVYYSFNRDNHVTKEKQNIEKNLPLNLCFDFNVYPYCVSWNQVLNDNNIKFIGEWVSKTHSNTAEACNEIIKILPRDLDVVIYGDASGRSGSANSNMTNYQIIDNIFKNHFKSVLYKVKRSNPAIRDRINCVNNQFSKNNIVISENCPKLILDLEQVVWNKNSSDLDKSNIERTHITDGLGYFIDYEYPIHKPNHQEKTKMW